VCDLAAVAKNSAGSSSGSSNSVGSSEWIRPINCDSVARAWHTACFLPTKNLLVTFGGERAVNGDPEVMPILSIDYRSILGYLNESCMLYTDIYMRHNVNSSCASSTISSRFLLTQARCYCAHTNNLIGPLLTSLQNSLLLLSAGCCILMPSMSSMLLPHTVCSAWRTSWY
jgi:hypothetical protein